MKPVGYPARQGLYDPSFEHDACGIGMICNIDGHKSHWIISDAVKILENMAHRGGVGAEPDSGDGAGILIQISHHFFAKVCANERIDLPAEGGYGVGMLFCSPDKPVREAGLAVLRRIVEEEGQTWIGRRDVPVNDRCIGETAREACPHICQVFIGRVEGQSDEAFDRRLFLILKRAEKEIRYAADNDPYFYIASLSARTIVYKGMLTPEQVVDFYLDLKDIDMKTALALVHSRFSTNTFPSWERAHPNRYLIHNGEINTIRGNINWSHAREANMRPAVLGEDFARLSPVIREDGSDSAMLDNYIQLLVMCGVPLAQAVMMAIPEPWEHDETMDPARRAFYEYTSCLMEPWDGPAAIGFTDGTLVGATLDRNGLRPARYTITKDGRAILASEAGVLNIPPQDVLEKGILRPGKLFLVDLEQGKILDDGEVKAKIAGALPYREWLEKGLKHLSDLPAGKLPLPSKLPLLTREKLFGYTWEDIDLTLREIAETGHDPITSMGTDIPLAVLSTKPQPLYNYFKQLFAQVTNPPIDAIREKPATSTLVLLGGEGDFLHPGEENCRRIRLETPILTPKELAAIEAAEDPAFASVTLPITFRPGVEGALENALARLFHHAEIAVDRGAGNLILSDRTADANHVPIPALLAVAGLHHHLMRRGLRMKASMIVESGEPREVHHFATLLGYGATAVCPYLALEIAESMAENGRENYIQAVTDGIVKIMSKMGISTLQSYQGAQIFEALGLDRSVVEPYFTDTVTRIGGLTMEQLERETLRRHRKAFDPATDGDALETGGDYKWRKDGETHLYNPETIFLLQRACRTGDYSLYKQFAARMDDENRRLCTIRGLLDIRTVEKPVPIDKVEPVEAIVRRFKTGAMSYGSISLEAHQCMAIAMNRLHGKSNSGEGGETADRYVKEDNGDSRNSAIKQVASGRFGVTIHYLQNAVEIQIKMAQGAKPGEGGHLPGPKVYPWIAKARGATPGVELVSPPPHHDIYSIEDLAQLIHDLKNANPKARIGVKLVSEAGVGTVAVGVAKGLADVILISGYDGGTGAAPRTSIRHTGLPWELGLAESHQALLLNHMRGRVTLETDGKLLTGRDIAVAALLGAEEFGFATAPLVVMGCVMMRVCDKDTCPVGIATQNPLLRARFAGKPEHIENFMRFIAQDLREWMAKIGVRTLDELVGRTEKLVPRSLGRHWKASNVSLTSLLYQPPAGPDQARTFQTPQRHGLEEALDSHTLLKVCAPALEDARPVSYKLEVSNINRTVGTLLSGEITKRYGVAGLPEDTVRLDFVGSAGQSFAAFACPGMTMRVEGDVNDYVGKGLSGGKIIVTPGENATYRAAENVVAGNVALYGASAGEAYLCGLAGERFAVRNSGAKAVVEGVGNHGCEYMTGGAVVILGSTGKNFGAGMSGGKAFVYDPDNTLKSRCQSPQLALEKKFSPEDSGLLKGLLKKHLAYTGSSRAAAILADWESQKRHFVMVIPKAYREMTGLIADFVSQGDDYEEAAIRAFNLVHRKEQAMAGKGRV